MIKRLIIPCLIVLLILAGCGNATTTATTAPTQISKLTDNAKMKQEIRNNYSDVFVEMSELAAQQFVIVYRIVEQDKILTEKEDLSYLAESYFATFDNATDSKQKEIIQDLRRFFWEYQSLYSNDKELRAQKIYKDTGKAYSEEKIKELDQIHKKQIGILKTNLINLEKYFENQQK